MALKKLPGGVIVETTDGARLNEEAGVNLEAIHRQIVAGAPTTEAAKAEAGRAKAEADRAAAVYAATPLGPTDLDTLTTPQRRVATLSTEVDAPNSPWPGRRTLYVIEATPDGSTVIQRAFELQGTRRAERVRFGGAWSPWATPGTGAAVIEDTAQDLNALTAPGDYVLVQSATGLVSGGVWSRTLDAGTWTPWQRLDNTTESAPAASTDAALTHRLLVEDFTRRRGGRKRLTTGAVAFRFDDGLNAFNEKVRPLMEARGLPYSLAVCSGRWTHPENNAVTADMVNAWVSAGLAEVWNHTKNHAGGTNEATWKAQILDGLTELRQQIPAAQIDGFAIPGTGTIGFQPGFTTGATIAEFYSTPAGRFILEHHAVATGAISGTSNRVMDGTVRQGMSHTTLDGATLSGAKGVVENAKRDRRGAQFMLHPTALDQSGKLSLSDLTAFLDYVVAERDAGRLAVLSPYSLMVADAT